MPFKIGPPAFDEGDGQLRGVHSELREDGESPRNADGGNGLPEQLGARGEAEVAALYYFDVVVYESDGAEGERRENSDPDERIGKIGPEQRGQNDCDEDEHAAHSGRAGFLLVRLRTFFADVLADLELAQLLDDEGTDDERNEKGRERREGSAEGQIAKDAERVEERKEILVEQPIEHMDSSAREKDLGRFYRPSGVGAVNARDMEVTEVSS